MLITRVYDDFDRAAVADNLGALWTDHRGAGLGVTTNQAFSAVGVRSSLYTAGTLPADQWAEVAIAAPGTTGGARGVGLVVRGSGTSGNGTESGYYFEILTDGSNSYRLYKLVGNVETTIRGPTALPGAVAAGDVMRFEVEGTTLRAYLNDALLSTDTDVSLATGRAGLLLRGTTPRANDFASGDFIDVPEYTRVPVDSDNFNRPAGALGSEWVSAGTGLAGYQITGNQVGGTATGTAQLSQYVGEIPSFNQYASITITDLGTIGTTARQINPWVRLNGIDQTRTGYGPNWRMDTGDLFIARRNANQSETVLAEFSARTPSIGDVLTTEVFTVAGGNVIRVYINDELIGSAFDNTPGYEDGTTGLAGYRNTVRGDNFTTGVLQVAGPSLVLAADANALTEDGASLVATGNVLDNDSAGLSVSAVRFGANNGTVGSSLQGTYGSLVLNANGTYTYTLANASLAVQSLGVGETAQDIFTYTASGPGGAASTTLTLTVTGANDAPVAAGTSVTTTEDTEVTGLLPAATDVDGDAVTYALASDAANGTVLIATDGSFSYTPDEDYLGPDAFTYSVSDGEGGSNTYAVTVTVNEEAVAGEAAVLITRAYDDFDRAAVADNLGALWTDHRGAGLGVTNNQAFSAVGVRSSLSTTGSLPGDQWAEVAIAAPGTTGGARGVGLVVRGSGTSGNGTESGYYFEILTDGSNSYRLYKLVGNVETTIRGPTALPGAVAAGDVMRFEVEGATLRAYLNDALLTTDTDVSLASGRAGLLLRGTTPRANDFASGDFIDVPEYTRVPVDSDDFNRAAGALGSEWVNAGTGLAGYQITGNQVEGTATEVSQMSQYLGEIPSFNQYASITITDLGTVSTARQINPWVRLNGIDETRIGYGPSWRLDNGHLLIYRRDNGQSETVIAEFSPRTPSVGDVLTTEVFTVDGGNVIRVYINDELIGSAFDNTPGHEDGTTGLIGFRNTVRGDDFTTGVLQIAGTSLPVLTADANALAEDGASLVATGNVLDNDSPGLSVSAVWSGANNGTVGSSLQGTYGALVLNASGTYTYTLANASLAVQSLGVDETAQDIFTYTASGPGGGASTTLTFTVTGANDAPLAAGTSVTTTEDTEVTGLLPVATDVDGDTVTYALASDAANGTVLVATDGSFSYTPDEDYLGPDAFTYSVSDGEGGSNTYAVTVTVNEEVPVTEAPVLITRVYDDFDRAAVADNLGALWTDHRGAGLGVTTNQAFSAVGVRSSLYTAGTLPADQWAEVAIAAPGTTGGARGIGLVVRGSGTSGNATESGYYFEILTDGSNSYRLYKLVGNVETTIRGPTALPGAVAAGDVMRFEVEGTTLRAYLNDALLSTDTDVSLATGRAGLLLRGTTPRANDFASGDFIDVPEYTRVPVDSDDFNRPAGALGSEWVNGGTGLAGYQITGNQVGGTATGTPQQSQYVGDIPSFNQYASITITDPGTIGTARQLNPWVRLNGIDGTRTGYGPNWRMDTGDLFIARRNANQSETVLAEFSARTPSIGDVLTTEVFTVAGGNVIRVYINDELIGSAFDNTPGYEDGTTGLAGYRNTVRGDNFTTGVLEIAGASLSVLAAANAVVDAPVATDDTPQATQTGGVDNDTQIGQRTVSGRRDITDAGTGQRLSQIPTDLDGDYGKFAFAADGTWSYVLDHLAESLTDGHTVFETFGLTALDGSASATINIAVYGADDVPEADPDPLAAVTIIGVSEQRDAAGEYYL